MADHPLYQTIIAVLAVGVGALLQSVFGFAFALVVVPTLSAILSPIEAVALSAAIAPVTQVALLVTDGPHADKRVASKMAFGILLGAPIGAATASRLPISALKLLISVVIVITVAVINAQPRASKPRTVTDLAAGLGSGLLSTTTGTNGPPLVIALHGHQLTPKGFRGTLSIALIVANAASFILLRNRIENFPTDALMILLPAAAVGYLVGSIIRKRVHPDKFKVLILRLLLAVAVVTAATTIVKPR